MLSNIKDSIEYLRKSLDEIEIHVKEEDTEDLSDSSWQEFIESMRIERQATGDPFIDELISIRDMLDPVIDAELENGCSYTYAMNVRKDINNAILRYKTRNAQYATREEVSDENIPGLSRDDKGRIAPFTVLPSQAKFMAESIPDLFTYDLYTDINTDNIKNVLWGNENFSNSYFKGYINYLKALVLDVLNEFKNDINETPVD